ncbi:MAG: oligosaccharide flippase family protein [bacterium]
MNEPKEKKKGMMSVFQSGETDDDKKKRFEAGGIISMGAFAAGGIFQILWMSTITRMLGPQDMGLFGPLLFGFFTAATLIGIGVPQTIVTFVSLHCETNFEEARRFLTDGLRLILQVAIVALVVVGSIGFLLGLTGALEWVYAMMIVAFVAAITQASLFWGFQSVLNGFQRLDLIAVGNMAFPVGVFGASIVLIYAGQTVAGAETKWDVVGAVGGLGLGHTVAAVTALICLHKLRKFPTGELFALRSKHGLYGKILKFGGWAAVGMTSMTIVQNLPAIVVRVVGVDWYLLFGETKEACEMAVGYFSTAFMVGMAAMLLVGIAIAIIPAISEAEGQGRKDLMQHYYTKALEQSFAILLALIIVFIVMVGPIIELMSGPQYPAEKMHLLGVLAILGGSGAGILFVMVNMFIGLKRPRTPGMVMIAVVLMLAVSTAALSLIFKDVHWALAGFIFAAWFGDIVLFNRARVMFGLRFPFPAMIKPVLAGVGPLLLVLNVMPAPTAQQEKLWIMGVDLLLLLVPYGLILWVLSVVWKDREPVVEGV